VPHTSRKTLSVAEFSHVKFRFCSRLMPPLAKDSTVVVLDVALRQLLLTWRQLSDDGVAPHGTIFLASTHLELALLESVGLVVSARRHVIKLWRSWEFVEHKDMLRFHYQRFQVHFFFLTFFFVIFVPLWMSHNDKTL